MQVLEADAVGSGEEGEEGGPDRNISSEDVSMYNNVLLERKYVIGLHLN